MPTYPPASSTLTLTGDDGSIITLAIAVTANVTTPPPAPGPDPAPPPPPPPPVDPVPQAGQTVTIGSSSRAVDGRDQWRDTNHLTVFTPGNTNGWPTNQYGVDVTVTGGKVAARFDRLTTNGTAPAIPAGGYVLSGHGTARDWLLANAVVGATVTIGAAPPPPPPTPPPTPGAWPTNMIAGYKKMFNGDPGRLGDYTTAGCNVVFLAFANQSSGRLRLCGHSAQGKASLVADIRAHQATGGKVSVSIGGAGFPISTSNTAGFVADFDGIAADLGVPIDGIDWDLEHDNVTAEIVAISKALKAKYGPNFGVTYSVGGVSGQTAIDNRIATGKALHAAGVLDAYSWQLYDTPVDLGTAKWRLGYCIDRGIPKDKMCVGMMLGSTANYWDNTEARTYMADIKATMGLTRTALWTEGWNGNDTQWARDMRAIIG